MINQILGLDELVRHLNTHTHIYVCIYIYIYIYIYNMHILYIQDAFLNFHWAWTDVICIVYRSIPFVWSVEVSLPVHYAHCIWVSVVFTQLDLTHPFFGKRHVGFHFQQKMQVDSKHGSGSHPTAASSSWI